MSKEEIDLTELPQTPSLKEKKALCIVLQSLEIGEMENFGVGFTIQKVDEKTLRFIRAADHPVAAHFVDLFIETGEELGIKMEVNPYLVIFQPKEKKDEDDNITNEEMSNEDDNMFV